MGSTDRTIQRYGGEINDEVAEKATDVYNVDGEIDDEVYCDVNCEVDGEINDKVPCNGYRSASELR